MARPCTSPIAVALCTLVFGVTPAAGQSASASVRASVTVLDPVGAHAPSLLVLHEVGAGTLVVDGALEVTSPVPHVLTSSESSPGMEAGALRTRWCDASRDAVPRWIRTEIVPPAGDGPVRITYTVAVIL